ncbi:hypothetical protein PybrP1_011749, partial [[Pythium] brassicae (nom. inval.)]
MQTADDMMSCWLVDICNQLSADEPPEARTSTTGLDASPVTPLSPLPAPIFLPYGSASASSSPGSSSSSSGGDSSATMSPLDPPRARGARRAGSRITSDMPATGSQLNKWIETSDPDADESQRELAAAEARREKNRLRVRRHYYRKLSLMNDLRAQVSELEEKIGQLQLHQQPASSRGGAAAAAATPSEASLYLQQLDATKRALEQENRQVREILYQQTRQFMLARQQHLQQLLAESQLLGTSMPVPFVVKRRLVPQDCDRIWQSAKRDLSSLVIRNALPTTAELLEDKGDTIFGWKTTRAVEDGAFKFVFQKLLRGYSAARALDVAWAVFSDPKQFAKLYSPAVDMWCALVQAVDANNVVLFQEHKSMDANEVHVVMKTILLVSRVRNPSTGDFSLTLRGIEHEQLRLEDLSVTGRDGYEVWNDLNA